MKKSGKTQAPKIGHFKLSQITPAKYNPRTIDDEAMAGLSASMERFGCVEPIVVNVRGGRNIIIGGHQRYKALIKLYGKDHLCECVTVDIGKTDEKLLNIALNNPMIQGEFIKELAGYIDKLRKNLTNKKDYFDFRINLLRNELRDPEKQGKIDDDQVPDVPKKPVAKPGDLWILGKHRLLCGDCTIEASVERLMAGKKADMVFTDPPYGAVITSLNADQPSINRSRHWDMIEGDQFENEELQAFLEKAFKNISKTAKDNAAWYIWHTMLTQGFFAAAAAAAADLILNRQIIWVKPCLILSFGDYHWRHELCFYGWKKGFKPDFFGGTNATTVWEIDFDGKGRMPTKERKHPTQKPTNLAAKAIYNSSKHKEIVQDLFLGSGTTLIACEKLNRRCYGMEIEPKYCDVIVKRWEEWTGRKGRLVKGTKAARTKNRVERAVKTNKTAHRGTQRSRKG